MGFTKLLLYIGVAILGFWLLGLLLKLATWIIDIVLVVGLVLVILSFVNEYYENKKKTK